MKATLVFRLDGGVPSVYVDTPLDLEIIVDESSDYRQGMADIPAYYLDPEVNPEEVAATLGLVPTQEISSPDLP